MDKITQKLRKLRMRLERDIEQQPKPHPALWYINITLSVVVCAILIVALLTNPGWLTLIIAIPLLILIGGSLLLLAAGFLGLIK